MKIIPIQYQCEICDNYYDTEKEALECEAKSKVSYPIGCIYGNHTSEGFYKDITFAVANNHFRMHTNIGGSWACRDNNHFGDSLGEETCGGNSLELNEYQGKVNKNHPTFKRMITWLKSQNIPITVWNGKEAIPYND